MKNDNTSNRLKKIMNEKGLKQVDLINKCKPICEKYNKKYNLNIKITKSDLSQWLKGIYEPSQSKLTVLSEALNTTETWLMGYDISENDQMKVNFSLTLFELMRYYQMDNTLLNKETGINPEKIEEFIKQKSLPTDDELDILANIFDLKSKDEFFDGKAFNRVIEKYKLEGEKLIDKYKFGINLENMLVDLCKETDISLEEIKKIILNRTNDLDSFITYEDLYNYFKRILMKK